MFVWDYWGLPIKIDATNTAGTRTWAYFDLSVNTVKTTDMEHEIVTT
jgi:hypothetical protein